ncbi:MAG: DUF547 domain-containing protein [Desulfobacterales bacterium]|nr:DUF547 domain-containing protein [Desulfobacterales bacterium]
MKLLHGKVGRTSVWSVLGMAVLLFPAAATAAGNSVDHALFGELLDKYVHEGVVNYAGFKAEENKLDRYLAVLENTNSDTLGRKEQFAFYINAYNAWTIKLILTGYPGVKSIKDLGSIFQSPWKREFVRINGKTLTLDEIEHKILRPRFKDPRVHFAVNCASKSCPPLVSEPYRGAVLNAQLDQVTRNFINTPGNCRLEGDTFWVSSIFKWFSEDFNDDPVGFHQKYSTGDLNQRLQEKGGRLNVRYLDYDWSLNGF